MVAILQAVSFETFCVWWEYTQEQEVPLANQSPTLPTVILASTRYFPSRSVILPYRAMLTTGTHTVLRKNCFPVLLDEMGIVGPCNSTNIHKYLYCFRNITNSSWVQPNQTGHFWSNSFSVLKSKYNRNTITSLKNFNSLFYLCEDEDSKRQKSICLINK